MTTDQLRLVKLARISMARDDEQSTANQHWELDQAIARLGAVCVAEFVEVGKSGFHDIKRPHLDEALAMVRNGFADGIVVWKFDRFTRKGAKAAFRMIAELESGNGFLIVSHDDIDTRREGMADIIKLVVIAEQAKKESEDKSDRQKSWHRGRARDNKAPNGPIPFGYDRPQRNKLAINDTEADAVRDMAAMIIGGKSLRHVCRTLTAAGVKPKSGGKWNPVAISRIVRNPVTTGARYVKMDDGTTELVDGGWDAILPRETWEQCNRVLCDPSRNSTTPEQRATRYLLSGIATCGRDGCGKGLKSERYPNDPTRRRYGCGACFLSIDMETVDTFVTATTLQYLAGDAWRELRSQGRKYDNAAVERLTAKIATLRERWHDDKLTDEEWFMERDALTARIADIQNAPVLELPDVDDLEAAWNHPTNPLDVDGKRQVIIAATKSVVVLPYASGTTGYDRVLISI